jgi:hypothetical protein
MATTGEREREGSEEGGCAEKRRDAAWLLRTSGARRVRVCACDGWIYEYEHG